MKCDAQRLAMFLDGELDAAAKGELAEHLAACPTCRRELGQLKLLWFELEQDEKPAIPKELMFYRQQAVTVGMLGAKRTDDSFSILRSQEIAWRPVMTAIGHIPGADQVGPLTRRAGKAIGERLAGAVGRRLGLDRLFGKKDQR